jgi:hypothetical protein
VRWKYPTIRGLGDFDMFIYVQYNNERNLSARTLEDQMLGQRVESIGFALPKFGGSCTGMCSGTGLPLQP